ncbi:MAG TPA: helix-turn-helix transcriptional regulator [Candidatus Hodarchaeales archaeon]|nr:helix-turn-helix transcriptional regulator [Candidatus Hodarchaeales archaeon]
MKLGQLIKSLRISHGISQKELSEKLDMSTNYLCLIETSKRMPSADLIARIAKELKISKDALDFLSTDVPTELDKENSKKYMKLQENVAALLLFQGRKIA